MNTFSERLQSEGAHYDVVSWVGERSAEEAWNECPRGDWLLGWAARFDAPRPELIAACADCTALCIDLLDEDLGGHLRAAVETARRHAVDGTHPADSDIDAWVRRAEQSQDPVHQSGCFAVAALFMCTRDSEHASAAAANAVQCATMAAGDCAMMSAMRYTHDACAKAVRKHVRFSSLAL